MSDGKQSNGNGSESKPYGAVLENGAGDEDQKSKNSGVKAKVSRLFDSVTTSLTSSSSDDVGDGDGATHRKSPHTLPGSRTMREQRLHELRLAYTAEYDERMKRARELNATIETLGLAGADGSHDKSEPKAVTTAQDPPRDGYVISDDLPRSPYPRSVHRLDVDAILHGRSEWLANPFAISRMLGSIRLSEVSRKRRTALVVINRDASLEQAFELMSKEHLHALPVVASSAGDTPVVVGIVSLLDLLAVVIRLLEREDFEPTMFTKLSLNHWQAFDAMELFVSLSEQDSLKSAALAFSQGAHRVAITNAVGHMIGVFTQTDMLWVLNNNRGILGTRVEASLMSLGVVRSRALVVAVDRHVPVATVLQHMKQHHIQAVAVVDRRDDTFIGQLAVGHLKALSDARDFYALFEPVERFLIEFTGPNSDDWTVRLPWTATLGDALTAFTPQHAADSPHRLWLVDEYQKLRGLVSQGDVIKRLLQIEAVLPPPLQSQP
jgi:CBS-domain-containing membrane protein